MDNLEGDIVESQNDFIELATPDFVETYRNIKHLIFDGFIPVRLSIGDTNLTLKSIYPREFSYIEMIAPKKESERIPYYFLYSIVFLDGIEIQPHKKELHDPIVSVFNKMHAKTVEKIFNVLTDIQRYYSASYENLEGYLYEKESRYLWTIYKQSILGGFTNSWGYNTAQESWISFNQREDRKEQMDMDFNNAKFIVSALVGSKEVRKLDNLEKMRETEELRRRQEIRLKNKTQKLRLTPPVNTKEELVQELHKQMRGEKDLHDKIIERHEKIMADREKERNEKLAVARKIEALNKPKVQEGSKFVTAKEMEERLKSLNVSPKRQVNVSNEKYLDKLTQYQGKQPEPAPGPQFQGEKKSVFDPSVQKALEPAKKILDIGPKKPT